ncbi:hypothetical protein OIU78_015058 [Salix suchowensis]|nr:hypothetical protein OIU78_015058 [Salix suchowensis]KAJ6319561.1 hypothetical protein OIU78_015058 [Salix suchowensis]
MTEDYGKLEKELEKAFPLAIINKALQKFIDGSAISFSGAKDVSLILQSGVFQPGNWERKDQSPGSRASVPALKIDPSVEGIGCGAISLLRWNPVASLGGQATWNFLQTMDVPLRYVSTDCATLTRPAFPWLHERGGRRWWEEGKVMERGLHEGNIESEDEQISEHMNGAVSFPNANDPVADVLSSQNLTSLSRAGEEIVGTFKNRTGAWLDVLYAPWRHFFQAMESSYAKLVDAEVKTGKFRVDGEHRAFANQKLQLRIFTTTVIFPGSKPIKYSSEKRDVDSQLAFVSSLQW